MSGYVRIHRSLIGHPAFRNDAEAMAFAWMVAKAAYKPRRVRYKGHDIDLKRGQLTVSIRDFAEAMDRPKGWAERLFLRLRQHGMIEQKNGTQVGTQVGTHGGTVGGTPAGVVTICNYDEYQAETQARETRCGTADRTRAGQRQDTEQVSKEVKEDTVSNETVPANDDEIKPEHVVEAWNAMAETCGLPQARLTANRRPKLRTFIKANSADDITEAIWKIPKSDFLCGRNSNRDWRADLDFLLTPSKFTKILEGSYG